MKINKMIIQTVIVLALAIIFGFLGFVSVVLTLLFSGQLFYGYFVGTIALIGFLLTAVALFRVLPRRRMMHMTGLILLLLASAVTGYEIREAWLDQLTLATEQHVHLYDYTPFGEQSKLARLSGSAELLLVEPLPRMDGATALYPLYAAFAQAVYPEKVYAPYDSEVMSTTTREAFGRLLKGEADIVFAAQPSRQQLSEAEAQGTRFRLTPIGKEAFVFFTSTKNPVSSLTAAQLRAIYGGQLTNWKAVGGENARIRAFQRPESSGSQTMLQAFMGDTSIMPPTETETAVGMGDMMEQVADYRNHANALGYSFLFFVSEMIEHEDLKLLAVDGIKPSRASIADGSYPLASCFYAVTLEGQASVQVNALLDWMQSAQGQELVALTGYTPLEGSGAVETAALASNCKSEF